MTLQNLYVGLFYDDAWHDVTLDVRSADPIKINRGKAAATDVPKPSSIFLTFDNRSGTYNPRNAMSPLYGKVGRNTPIIVAYNPVDEDFEDTSYNVTLTPFGAVGWARSNTQAHTGTWSFKSGAITAGQESDLNVSVPAGANTLQFWYRVDSESGFDYFEVFTSEGLQLFDSGFRDWTFASIDVTGSTVVTFAYNKDATITVGADAAWIDDLRFLDARGIGEITSWNTDRTPDFVPALGLASKGDAWTAIEAYGLLSRIGVASDPIRSALYRAVTMAATTPIVYVPCEDQDGSAQAVSGIGGDAMTPVTTVRYTLPDGTPIPPGGAPKFQQDGGVPGADRLVSLTDGGTLRADIPAVANGGYAVDFVFRFNPGGNDGTVSADIASWRESGTYVHFTVNVDPTTITVFHANAAADATLSSSGSAAAAVNVYDGTPHHFRYTVGQSGGNYLGHLYIDGNLVAVADNFVPPMAGTVGHPTSIELNPGEDRGDYMPVAIGHVTVWPTDTPPNTVPAAFGNPGEQAKDRLRRFGVEQGWPVYIRSDGDQTMRMGPQPVAALGDQLGEIERTEDGLLFDQRGRIGVILRTRRRQYAQTPRIQLDTGDGTGAIQRALVDDNDLRFGNDVTVQNRSGAEVIAIRSTGPLSVLPPPDGAGRAPVLVRVNADAPVDLTQVAGWWLNKGTVDLPRYPNVIINPDLAPGLAAAAGSVDPGDRITMAGFEHDLVDLRVLGTAETIGSHLRTIAFLCEPYQQYNVAVYVATGATVTSAMKRYDSRTSTTNTTLTTTVGTIVVKFTDLADQWSQVNEPYDWMIAGERIRVTSMGAVTGTGPWTQTATVTRSINSVVKTHGVGEPIHMHPDQQARYAL